MKNFKYLFLLAGLFSILTSCESDDEKYSGTPVGNQQIVQITGEISTTATVAFTNQRIPFHIKLPQAFADTVRVEVSTFNKSGGRTRVSVEMMPGQTEADDDVPCAGGLLFDSTVDMRITAINLNTVEIGKHYLMTSNNIVLRTGDTPVPALDNTRLSVRLAWPKPASSLNNIRLTVTRPAGSTPATHTPTLESIGTRTYSILSTLGTVPNNNAFSGAEGEYIFRINAQALVTSPVDLPYRFIVRFPDGTTKIFEGVYPAMTTASPPLAVLKATKVVDPGSGAVSYIVTDQGL